MTNAYDELYALGSPDNVYSTALPDGSFIPTYVSSYDPRPEEFLTQFNRVRAGKDWSECSFLDLASSEGSTTLGIAQMGSNVHGVEGRAGALNRANVIRDLIGFSNVTYELGNVMDATKYRKVSGIFASGILYHLEDPIGFLELCAEHASDFIYIDSHRMPYDHEDVSATPFVNSLSNPHVIDAHGLSIRGIEFKEANTKDEEEDGVLRRPRTGIGNTFSVWLSLDDMIELMAKLGFPYHQRIHDRSNFLRSRTAFFRENPSDATKVTPYTQPLPERKPALAAMQAAKARDVDYIKRNNLSVTIVGVQSQIEGIQHKLDAENIAVDRIVVLPGQDGKPVHLGQLTKILEGVKGFVVVASTNPHQIYQQLILFPEITYVCTSFGMVIKEAG
ncbi:hypothetical protein EI983_07570 [Roseovarius faecimaris]|uniref:Class I SAM-dependent methyltransferase n=1 Tax=Roseovarius faecimaris TaxID=2494550 RepID=A0A6I6IPT7_9RHOB|nr:hypothetical protein [Roseovarius faecimaris]QGX98144.1 hypothetical protein EI983_07570 [Roseovarius faecimaris]